MAANNFLGPFATGGEFIRSAEEGAQRMRTYERDKIALNELRRFEQAKRELASGSYGSFTPMQIPEVPTMQFQNLAVENVPSVAPAAPAVSVPFADTTSLRQLDPNSPQARALAQQRLERLRTQQSATAGVPLRVPGAASKAGEVQAEGITQINPEGSQFMQFYQRSTAQGQVRAGVDKIAKDLMSGDYGGPGAAPIRRAYGFFADEPKVVAQRDKAIAAADWYRSDAGREYFQQNPKMLAEAKKDPIGVYDKVLQGEKSLKEAVSPKTLPASKRTASWDKTTTPYDELMLRSAQENGIDPVIFKRLIGSESGFQTNLPSPRGEKFGLGIAQIASSHGLSREARLDPNQSLPYAAKLLAQYVRDANGNYEEALLRYKGATSDKGRASMRPVVRDILSGAPTAVASLGTEAGATVLPGTPGGANVQPQTYPGRPGAPANVTLYGTNAPPSAAPARGATAPVTAATEVVQPQASFYMANPESIPMDMQVTMQARQLAVNQRNELARMADIYMRSGTSAGIQQAMALRQQIVTADQEIMQANNGLMYLQGMQGLNEFQLANDPRRLGAVWSQYAGVPVGIQPRSDGKYNIIVNGQRTKEGVSAADISDSARSAFDGSYRQQKAETAKTVSIESFKKGLDAQVEAVKQQAQMVREATVEMIKRGTEEMKIRLGREDFDLKPVGDGTARAYIFNKSGSVLGVIDAVSGQFVEMDGVKVPRGPSYSAVSGAPVGVSGNVR